MDAQPLTALSRNVWPPQLSVLDLVITGPECSDQFMDSLPSTIKSLFLVISWGSFSITRYFPPALTALNVVTELGNLDISVKLPETIVELELRRSDMERDELRQTVAIDLSSQELPCLQRLSLDAWPYAKLHQIPQSCVILHIHELITIEEDGFDSSYCYSSATLQNAPNFSASSSSYSVNVFSSSASPSHSQYCIFKLGRFLPPLLRHLDIGSVNRFYWLDPCLDALQRLETAWLDRVGYFDPQILAQFSPNLVELGIYLTHFNDDHGHLLNPKWHSAHINLKEPKYEALRRHWPADL